MSPFYGKLCDFETQQLRLIHDSSMEILERLGLYCDHDYVLEKLSSFGAQVDFDKKTAKFPRGLVEDKLFTFKNAADRGLPGETLKFAGGGEAEYVLDMETGKYRSATLKDLGDAVKVADKLPYIDEVDTFVYIPGIPSHVSDLYTWKTVWTYTAKTGGGGLSRNGNAIQMYNSERGLEYVMRLAAIKAGGVDKLRQKPITGGAVTFASPLRLGRDVLSQLVKLVDLKQYIGLVSNCAAGIAAPATFAGVITVENAERLGGLMAVLSLDENAHVYFGNHPQYLDMSVGSMAAGSAEHALAALLGNAVLKYYGLNHMLVSHPAASTSSHLPDQQAGIDKTITMLIAGLAGHKGVCALGMLHEAFSFEQLIIDNEIAGTVRKLLAGLTINEEQIDLRLILEAGIGGNYLEYPEQIMNQVRNSYFKPTVLNRSRYPIWASDHGGRSITDRAKDQVKRLLSQDHTIYLTEDQIRAMDELIIEAKKNLL